MYSTMLTFKLMSLARIIEIALNVYSQIQLHALLFYWFGEKYQQKTSPIVKRTFMLTLRHVNTMRNIKFGYNYRGQVHISWIYWRTYLQQTPAQLSNNVLTHEFRLPVQQCLTHELICPNNNVWLMSSSAIPTMSDSWVHLPYQQWQTREFICPNNNSRPICTVGPSPSFIYLHWLN